MYDFSLITIILLHLYYIVRTANRIDNIATQLCRMNRYYIISLMIINYLPFCNIINNLILLEKY